MLIIINFIYLTRIVCFYLLIRWRNGSSISLDIKRVWRRKSRVKIKNIKQNAYSLIIIFLTI